MIRSLSHVDQRGAARMVDVGEKPVTRRRATAAGVVQCSASLREAVLANTLRKGSLIDVARLAGIMAAKRTSDLIPLCHPLPLDAVDVAIELTPQGFSISATVQTEGRTGVEMEALTAVGVAGLTIIDMGKAVDPAMVLSDVRLIEKTGGKSDYRVAEEER